MHKKTQKLICMILMLLGCLSVWGCGGTEQAKPTKQAGVATNAEGLVYKTAADANGKPMAVVTGTILDKITEKYLPKSKFFYFNGYADCLSALKIGKVEGFLCDEPVAREMKRTNPDIGYIKEPVMKDSIGIGINKNRNDIKQALDAGIKKYKQDGTLKKLDDIWFGGDDSLKKMPELKAGSKGTVICASVAENAPLCYMVNGQVVGYEASIITSILQDAGYTVQLQPWDTNGSIPAVASGKADLLFGSISITDERKKSILFSEPDYASGIVLVEKKVAGAATASKQLMYNSLKEMNGKPLSILSGTVFDKTAEKYLPKSPQKYYNTIADCLQALKSGKTEGFIIDEPIFRGLQPANPDIGAFQMVDDGSSFALVLAKDNELLQKIMNEGIRRYKKDGTLKKLDEIWFGSDDSLKKMPAKKEGTKGTIICGTSAEYYPIGYIKDGEVVGYEPALATSILQEAGYNVKFQNMDFNALIPSIVTHKIDVAMGCILVTDERKKSVFMTEPEYKDTLVMAVRMKNVGSPQGSSVAKLWNDLKDGFNKNFIVENRYKMILDGLKTTINITFGSAILGTLLGILFCVMRRSSKKILSLPIEFFVKVMQGTPFVVFLMIMYYVVFGKLAINPVYVAIISFALNFGAYTSGEMGAGIDTVDKGQREASYAMGFTKVQTFVKIVIPQALRYIVPAYTGEFISMLKMTSIVGYIAIQDLTKMSDVIRSRTYEAFFPLIATALIYLVVAWILAAFLTYLQHKIDPKKRPRTLKGVQL